MLLVRIIIYLGIIALIWLAIVVAVGFTREYKKAEKQKKLRAKNREKKE